MIGRMGRPPTSEWGLRASAAGLDQKTLALLAGAHVTTVSRGLAGKFGAVSPGLCSVIIAWEQMTPMQREAWIAAVSDL